VSKVSLKVAVSPERLREFFNPKSVALVGATEKSMWSVVTYANLKTMNFPGEIYCINPNRDEVLGQKAHHSLLEIDAPIDLAYVMVPKTQIMNVMREAAQKKIRNLVILTAGFREVGDEGAKLEEELHAFALAHDQLILGPNGNGFVNVASMLTPYGLQLTPPLKKGTVGVVLQSGALASAILSLSQARNVGFSFIVSMGNETMLDATDVIDYLVEDEDTKVIALFLESIRNPEEFARVVRKAFERGKPVVALKIGRSEKSVQTAMAHTGSLVGNDSINDAAFRQLGVIRVNSLEDLLTTAGLLGYTPPLPGRRMAAVTPSGGACDILSDRSEDEKIELPDFSPDTVEKLKQIVPDFSTVHNPLDVTGFILVDRSLLRRSLEAVSTDAEFDFVLCLTDPPRIKPEDPALIYEQYTELARIVKASPRPIILCMNTALDITPFGKEVMDKFGLHFVGGMEHGMTAIGKAVWWHEKYRTSQAKSKSGLNSVKPSLDLQVSGGEWSEFRARNFLQKHGVPVVPGIMAQNAEEAIAAAQNVGLPVAMKIQSEDIAHKSDIGGVVLNINSEQEVVTAYQTILENVQTRAPGSRIEGILVSPMRPAANELLVGIVKDPLWGLVLAVGIGGIFVEVLKDASLRVLPVDRAEIRTMFEELRGIALLKGTRGRVAADLDQVADAIYKVSELALAAEGHLQELEINPLWVQGAQVEALDALIKWKSADTVLAK
jgi:acyl-CoA synthetase (NDP forming)